MVGCDNDSSASVVEACNAAGVDHLLVASEATTGTYKFNGFNEYDCGYHQAKYVVVQRGAGREGVRSGGRRRPLPTMSAARLGRAGQCPTWSTHLETGEFTAEKAMQLTDDWCRPIPRIQFRRRRLDHLQGQQDGPGRRWSAQGREPDGQGQGSPPGSRRHWDATWWRRLQGVCRGLSFQGAGRDHRGRQHQVLYGEEVPERSFMALYDITLDNYGEYFGK